MFKALWVMQILIKYSPYYSWRSVIRRKWIRHLKRVWAGRYWSTWERLCFSKLCITVTQGNCLEMQIPGPSSVSKPERRPRNKSSLLITTPERMLMPMVKDALWEVASEGREKALTLGNTRAGSCIWSGTRRAAEMWTIGCGDLGPERNTRGWQCASGRELGGQSHRLHSPYLYFFVVN